MSFGESRQVASLYFTLWSSRPRNQNEVMKFSRKKGIPLCLSYFCTDYNCAWHDKRVLLSYEILLTNEAKLKNNLFSTEYGMSSKLITSIFPRGETQGHHDDGPHNILTTYAECRESLLISKKYPKKDVCLPAFG